MSLKDSIARSLAQRWLRGKMDRARKGGSTMLKALDGNKRLLVVLGFIVSGFVNLLTGTDVSQWLGLILRTLGWTDPAMIETAKTVAAKVAPMLFAIWAAAHSLWKMYRQWKAGASLVELNSTAGIVKAARADGSLARVAFRP